MGQVNGLIFMGGGLIFVLGSINSGVPIGGALTPDLWFIIFVALLFNSIHGLGQAAYQHSASSGPGA